MSGDPVGRIRTLLVDDEELARARMRDLLSPFEDIAVIGEASDGEEALALARSLSPDLVFLDIEMPGKSGLEVACALAPPRPAIVYCTAFDRYAVKAFELNALDYLLKPVSRARLGNSLEKVRTRINGDRNFRREIEMAEETQSGLFPHRLPRLATLDYTGTCRPVRWVSGDYYDFLPVGEGQLGIAVGDVSGKGMSAGLLMAGLQGRLRSDAIHFGADIQALAASLNRSLCETTDAARFVTFFYGVYDDGTRVLEYVNAGHNPPLLIRGSGIGPGRIERLSEGGMVLGVWPGACYEKGSVRIEPGDQLALFTDGVTEAMNPGELEFGEERLLELLCRDPEAPLDRQVEGIFNEVESFRNGRPAEDDVTLVLARGR